MSDFCTCTPVYCTDMVAHHETCPQGRIEELEERNAKLREALEEAMDWNWLDDDMPDYVKEDCRKALEEQR